MEIALVDGKRCAPMPGLQGACPMCGQMSIAKCGPQLLWHWAHKGRRHCDPWWENETDWHRNWKGHFPEKTREVIQCDEITGERHIADVKTDFGMVIEFQHSPMPFEELAAREAFYQHMVWIVDARSFSDRFLVYPHPLPHLQSALLRDVVLIPGKSPMFWRPSENDPNSALVEMHNIQEIAAQITADYRGHHGYEWKRPHKVWLHAHAPVLLDFGKDELYRLTRYTGVHGAQCVQKISKARFIEKNGGQAQTLQLENPSLLSPDWSIGPPPLLHAKED